MQPEDQKAIGATGALLGGFSKRDAAMLEAVYSDDATWSTPSAPPGAGRAEIVAYLRGLFADANFGAAKLVAPPESRLRRIGGTGWRCRRTCAFTGQGLVGGGTIDVRDNHSLHPPEQPDGRWLGSRRSTWTPPGPDVRRRPPP